MDILNFFSSLNVGQRNYEIFCDMEANGDRLNSKIGMHITHDNSLIGSTPTICGIPDDLYNMLDQKLQDNIISVYFFTFGSDFEKSELKRALKFENANVLFLFSCSSNKSHVIIDEKCVDMKDCELPGKVYQFQKSVVKSLHCSLQRGQRIRCCMFFIKKTIENGVA